MSDIIHSHIELRLGQKGNVVELFLSSSFLVFLVPRYYIPKFTSSENALHPKGTSSQMHLSRVNSIPCNELQENEQENGQQENACNFL